MDVRKRVRSEEGTDSDSEKEKNIFHQSESDSDVDAEDVKEETKGNKPERTTQPQGGRITSDVWRHFSLTSDRSFAVCNHCKKQLKYAQSTSNLQKHLKMHPSVPVPKPNGLAMASPIFKLEFKLAAKVVFCQS
jgi:hypothetical protein